MSEDFKAGTPRVGVSELESLRGIRVCLLALGIALMILGFAAIGSAFITALATMLAFGILLLMGAVVQVANAFFGRRWRGFFLHLLAGILYFIAGMFMIERPVEAALGLTMVLAACLLVGGIFRIVLSVAERFEGWGWVLLNGIVSVLLGGVIWRQGLIWGIEIIGLFVGLEMLFTGLSWVMLALAVRSAQKVGLPT
ncbi:MAG TPA: HdeD family acid-resistance protein [Gemmataceae bacterium]|jgi:uncharacterized membrane protein HdeD (DUF308 family)|nr:HdeD family acid-resistance protein [Gemmataceae bacterium]